jgi:hypothetical protein
MKPHRQSLPVSRATARSAIENRARISMAGDHGGRHAHRHRGPRGCDGPRRCGAIAAAQQQADEQDDREHVDRLVAQLARIIADGVEKRAFAATDAQAAGRAVFDATARFHNPANSASWTDPRIAADYEQVTSLVLAGLSARA